MLSRCSVIVTVAATPAASPTAGGASTVVAVLESAVSVSAVSVSAASVSAASVLSSSVSAPCAEAAASSAAISSAAAGGSVAAASSPADVTSNTGRRSRPKATKPWTGVQPLSPSPVETKTQSPAALRSAAVTVVAIGKSCTLSPSGISYKPAPAPATTATRLRAEEATTP